MKLTNDIFGHAAGDELVKKSAEILKQACRQNDAIARVGGDEFIILLPKTTEENTQAVLGRIRSGFADAHVEAIKCSIALGHDIKQSPEQSLDETIANAENVMYRDKTMNRKATNKEILDTIMGTLHARNPVEKQHSIAVTELSAALGEALNLPETEISKLKRAAYVHDIGKIVHDENTLYQDSLTEEELDKANHHVIVGYRILNLFDDTMDLAENVYSHNERWDGSGYPQGLKGQQIPLISRIIAIVETYDRVLNQGEKPLAEKKQAALEVIRHGAGTKFDPKLAEVLAHIIKEKQ